MLGRMTPRRPSSVELPPELHEFLMQVAEERGVAIGDLIKSAVETRYEPAPKVVLGSLDEAQVRHAGAWKLPTFDAPLW